MYGKNIGLFQQELIPDKVGFLDTNTKVCVLMG